MGSSLLEFQSVGGHGCNRDAKVDEEVVGCGRMGCPDCEARRAVTQLMHAGVGTFERARFVHWPGHADEVVDEFTWEPAWKTDTAQGQMRVKVTRRQQDFLRKEAVATPSKGEVK